MIIPTIQGSGGDQKDRIQMICSLQHTLVCWWIATVTLPHPAPPLGPALCSVYQGGLKHVLKPPSRSWALHSFQSTYLIWSHFILTTTQMILTNPNEESRELYLHCNYHVAQNGSPPSGGKLFLPLYLASSVFFVKPDHGAHCAWLNSSLSWAQTRTVGWFERKTRSTATRCPRLQMGKGKCLDYSCRLTIFTRCLVFSVGCPSTLSLKAGKKERKEIVIKYTQVSFCLLHYIKFSVTLAQIVKAWCS